MTMRTSNRTSLAQLRVLAATQAAFVAKVANNAGTALNRLGDRFQLEPLTANDNNEVVLTYTGDENAAAIIAARDRVATVLGTELDANDTVTVKLGRTTFKITIKGLPVVTIRKAA